MPTATTEIKLPGTPRPWMNAAMTALLKMPVVRAALGKMFLVLTVTGATTGTTYTMPVQYVRDGTRLIVLSQRTRRWWRNLRSRPEVDIVLRGQTIHTRATLLDGDEAREAIATTLRLNPRTAKFYGVSIGDDHEPEPDGLDQLHAAFVAIIIEPA